MAQKHDVPREAGGQESSPLKTNPRQRATLGLVCVSVIAIYAWIAGSYQPQMSTGRPEKAYYNLLVQGFRAGQLNLKIPVPPELAQLADPYDPVANEPYRLHDASYFKGKFYLYFGITPALALFWPYFALTGRFLSNQQATMIFCAVGFLASAGLMIAAARRYFPQASTAMVATCVFAVGLVNAVPVLLGRADVWEVPISCGYALIMLALVALWRALHEAATRGRWLAAASLAYGLAVGARPSLLPGAVILLVPIAFAWNGVPPTGRTRGGAALRLLTAAAAPIALIGIGLLVYNYLRFDSPWEFGQRYQLAGIKVSAQRLFSPDYFGSNVRMYFFQPLRWTGDYPFVQGIKVPPVPPGHLGAEGAFGALTNLPFLWLVGATLLVWRERRAAASLRPLRGFLVAVALLFVMNAATLCLFAGACDRYQAEFLPALTLLAAIGLLALEHAAASPTRFRLVRGAAMALLLVSAVTNWLASYKSSPEAQTVAGNDLAGAGAHAAAMEKYRQALRTEPDYAYAHHGLAIALAAEGRLPEAIEHFRQAVRSKPDFAEAHNGLGVALLRQQQPAEAEREFEAALRAAPDFAEAHFDCAVALLQLQRSREAIPHLEETLRLKPGFPGARERLELARLQTQATPKN